MPSITDLNGLKRYVPGVYGKVRVASSLPGPLPQFHIPILLGHGFDGHPYDVESKLVLGESDPSPFQLVNTDSAAAAWAGAQSDIHAAMRFAKRHGLPFAYAVNLSPMTRASIIADTVTTNIEQFTIYPRTFGPAGGWIKVGFSAGGVLTIIPVKRYAMLSANLGSSATRAYFARPHDWLTVGATVLVGSNAVTGVTRTITRTGVEMTSSGQLSYWIEISSSVGSACNTSAYAMVLQHDTDRTVVTSAFTTSQAIIDYLNDEDLILRAVKHANFTDALPATVATPTPIKEITAWNTVVTGTAPAVTGSDVDAFIADMNGGEWDQFLLREQVIPQTYLLVDGTSTNHGKLRDYATAERTRGYPISVTAGVRWGDHVIAAGDDTDPTFRAAALNSQDVMLLAGGLDREAAYVSLASAVWGRRVIGGPGHNLTNDELVFSHLERKWDEIDSGELSALHKKGVATYKLSPASAGFRYRVSQGLSTLQANNGVIWNESDATTWSVMQRDLADFVEGVLKQDFEESIIGADFVDANAIAAVLNRRAQRSLIERGYITAFTVTSIVINDAGNGYDVRWSVRLPDTVDFLTFETTILIGD